jgi:hypothetical protein
MKVIERRNGLVVAIYKAGEPHKSVDSWGQAVPSPRAVEQILDRGAAYYYYNGKPTSTVRTYDCYVIQFEEDFIEPENEFGIVTP